MSKMETILKKLNVVSQVQKLSEGSSLSKSEIDSLKFDVASVKAESSGLNVFVSSMQVALINFSFFQPIWYKN